MNKKDEKKPLSFGKCGFIYMMINCTIIEIYAMVVMFILSDLSALPGLIVAVVGECITVCAYYAKSTLENRAGGIIFEKAMQEEPVQETETFG